MKKLTPGTRIGAYVVNNDGGLVATYTPQQRAELGLLPESGFSRWVWDAERQAEVVAFMSEVPLNAPTAPVAYGHRRRTWEPGDPRGAKGLLQ